ncbi:E1-like protein-activating enzyme Gsa7p/Apg7p [Lophium mytilinum]|uniref:Ubiquitin-like modifier-activating enzyme ATG7 n=1 Tax=Lophium mytilinum TaxID=390894 RepID=A0A6A6QTR7_9PEZI|nr:E1-like protein-activating enzyme Gsa7p/Apg7p [Lophium mytilinum]
MGDSIKYATWATDIDIQFYSALAHIKINHDKLDDSARKVLGLYEVRPGDQPSRSNRMQIHGTALTTDETPANYFRAEGIIKNCNTIEDYRKLDRSTVIERAGRTIWEAVHDGSIYSCPSLLASFTAISFADLKKYKFTFHFGYPAIHSDPVWKPTKELTRLTTKETTPLVESVSTWRYRVDPRQRGFFIAKKVHDYPSQAVNTEDRPTTPQTPVYDIDYTWVVDSLEKFEQGFFNDVAPEDRYVGFADPSTFPDNPGWMLRNLLILIRHRWRLEEVQILCFRDTHLKRDQANSIILNLKADESLPPLAPEDPNARPRTPKLPKVTGWERNDGGKIASRVVDLSEYMDERKLADSAVDLNLKLIKWRIAPTLDLEVIKNAKCLLLGAGTLGSYVSRNLMGWGVRKITFIDNANVSFSNPVRQPLFDFKDCLKGGVKKAQRAAESLEEIYPGVDSAGHVMSVPMAGHPITDETKSKAEFELLQRLIDEHDVIFLLMDTRESRWLPTVMGKAAGKIVLNAALGFDTFVVMRHGLKSSDPGEEELGCYFCNDVVAPADSIKDATLDQQCTVTRPGIAPLASSLLVELLVSILQHPLRARAPATSNNDAQRAPSVAPASSHPSLPPHFVHPLGALPHTIRGFLSSFSNMLISGKPYDCCSACSDGIINLYKEDPWGFLKRALNERGWVEEVSGLAEVQRRAEEASAGLEWDENEGEFAEEEGDGELL